MKITLIKLSLFLGLMFGKEQNKWWLNYNNIDILDRNINKIWQLILSNKVNKIL